MTQLTFKIESQYLFSKPPPGPVEYYYDMDKFKEELRLLLFSYRIRKLTAEVVRGPE